MGMAEFGPGAINNGRVLVELGTNCLVANNTASGDGGGLYAATTNYIKGWIVMNNTSLGGSGGGVYLGDGAISNSTVWGNMATAGSGGGLYLVNGRAELLYVGSNGAAYGGGIAVATGVVVSCFLQDNVAQVGDGGGIYCATGLLVRGSVLVGNQAAGAGGGVALAASGGVASVQSCTISRNAAPAGSGVAVGSGSVVNTIVYENSPAETNWHFYAGVPTVAYSCAPDDLSGFGDGNVLGHPRFRDPGAGDYRPTVWSSCIDKGSNQAWMATSLDLWGSTRLVPTNGTVDIGAGEAAVRKRTSSVIILQ